ncbi:ABC transporter ATP-binding protein [Candidatus Bathyarchaeota archaeon]|nr:ABC transporter ATP-binding protein [Candidatus Bathyarchaeota archaeon]
MTLAVEMKDIIVTFPGVMANDNINFSLKKGEIHGLLGENGAGKSVLMKTLYGMHIPDKGKILVNGNEVRIINPSIAIKLGIGMVHQHFMLVPHLTVAENIILGQELTTNKFFLDMKKTLEHVSVFCDQYNLCIDLDSQIHSLPVGMQQRVEILKALYRGADILILDEPTSVLTPQESEELFKAVIALKDQGKTIVFISHKLKEVLQICDRITVLRKGKVIGTVKTVDTNQNVLAKMMVGREVKLSYNKEENKKKKFVLKVENVETINDRGVPALKGVNLNVNSFEILGIAGVQGNGQSELVEVITGLRKANKGKIILNDKNITGISPKNRIKMGISHIPEDRQKRGLILDFSVMENLMLGSHDTPPFSNDKFRINYEKIVDSAEKLIKDYKIKTPNKDTKVRYLSGGTQQRVVVAREFSRNPRLIITAQPTRGLDVGATEYVHSKLIEMRDQGSAILLFSADLDEIWMLSDRIAVMFEGKIVAIKDPKETNRQELGLLMAGAKLE